MYFHAVSVVSLFCCNLMYLCKYMATIGHEYALNDSFLMYFGCFTHFIDKSVFYCIFFIFLVFCCILWFSWYIGHTLDFRACNGLLLGPTVRRRGVRCILIGPDILAKMHGFWFNMACFTHFWINLVLSCFFCIFSIFAVIWCIYVNMWL